MKRGLKIFLLIILSCCYFNTVFEFSDTEKKINFENETHFYIHQDNQSLNITYTKTVKQLDNTVINWQTKTIFPAIINVAFSKAKSIKFSPPPERIYLRNSVFLI